MKTIHKSHKFTIIWNIFHNTTRLPFDFAGKDIEVSVFSNSHKVVLENYNVFCNVIEANIKTDTLPCGVYSIVCKYSTLKEQAYISVPNAFQISHKPVFDTTEDTVVLESYISNISPSNILTQFNSLFVRYLGSSFNTRNNIPIELRRTGLIITYIDENGKAITERASSSAQKDNDHWGLDVNWSRIDELSLSGDISVSENGTWIINGVDTGINALGPKGETGLTPWLKNIDNILHFSYDNVTWEPCGDPIAHYFRVHKNKLQISTDKQAWENVSDEIAAYFRFQALSSDGQNTSIGKLQISRDNKTWTDLSPEFTNNLRIVGYVATSSALPSNKPVGTIYGVGPTTDASGNPSYHIYVYDGSKWVNNGIFASITAGVVQETGDSETEVMSQKAVSTKLSELGSKLEGISCSNTVEAVAGSSYTNYIYLNAKQGDTLTISVIGDDVVSGVVQIRIGTEDITTCPINSSISIVLKADITYIAAIRATESVTGNGSITLSVNNTTGSIEQKITDNKNNIKALELGISQKMSICYTSGYINLVTEDLKISLSAAIFLFVDGNQVKIPIGDYALTTNVNQAFVYDKNEGEAKCVLSSNVNANHSVIAVIRNESSNLRFVASSVPAKIDGVGINDELKTLYGLSRNKYDAVISRGYIDINTIDETITSSAPIYCLYNGKSKTISERTDSFENSAIEFNLLNLVYDAVLDKFAFIDLSKLENSHIKIASVTRYGNIINHVTDAVIDVRINGVSETTRLEAIESKLEEGEDTEIIYSDILAAASAYEAYNKMREQYLRDAYKSSGDAEHWYGAEWKEVEDSNNVIAINSDGDSILHTTLPIHNRIKRCVVKDRNVNYYLDPDNSELKADGTSANLEGADGDIMVEIPEFFFRVEESVNGSVRTIRIKLSEQGLDGFVYSPKRYTSAYEVTINRTTNRLASVCTTLFDRSVEDISTTSESIYVEGDDYTRSGVNTALRSGFTSNATNYRGGTNDSSLDEETDTSSQNYSRNMLGLPASNLNRTQCREMSDAANGYLPYLYDTAKILWILFTTEYKTRNSQDTVLGMGATVYPDYNAYEAYWSPQGGGACLPCGVTNTLGNKSGVVYYKMVNVPIASTGSRDTIEYTQWGNVWMPCMSYRGVEHFWGHLYDIIDQVNLVIAPTTRYEDGQEGDSYYSYNNVYYYYQKNPFLTNNSIDEKYLLGVYEYMPNTNTISSLLMGTHGHILPIKSSRPADYRKNYSDCVEFLRYNSDETKYIAMNGRLVSNTLCGANFPCSTSFADSSKAVEGTKNYSRPSDGTRLDILI